MQSLHKRKMKVGIHGISKNGNWRTNLYFQYGLALY